MKVQRHDRGSFRILILSDVSLGRGVPQLTYLANSLRDTLGATVRVIEPDMKGAPEIDIPGVEIVREMTLLPPSHPSFAIDYARACKTHIERFRPEIVVATSGFMVLATSTCTFQDFRLIFYAFEDKKHQIGVPPYSQELLCGMLANEADFVLVPEINRASIDYPLQVAAGNLHVLYNASTQLTQHVHAPSIFDEQSYVACNPDVARAVASKAIGSGLAHYQRYGRFECRPMGHRFATECRFLFAGTIDRRSLLGALEDPNLQGINVDIFGVPSNSDASELLARICAIHPNIAYKGYVSNLELRRLSTSYSYRIVFWGDTAVNELYACPNKLFEALADGLPVVATPQPQVREVLAKWGCGLLTKDWGLGAASHALQIARNWYETEIYDQLRRNAIAAGNALSWDNEFKKIAPLFQPKRKPGRHLKELTTR